MIKQKKLAIFDLDDTLIFSHAKIQIYDSETNEMVMNLSPSQFNYHVKDQNQYMAFSDFECEKILGDAKMHTKMFTSFKNYIKRGVPVAIITARGNKNIVINFFKTKGIKLKPSFVFAVHDPKTEFHGTIADRKKQALEILLEKGFNSIKIYDDNLENLKAMYSLHSKKVNIKITHVIND
jgi:hypothetical protein